MITLEAERTFVHVDVDVAYAINRTNRLCASEQATEAAARARVVGEEARAAASHESDAVCRGSVRVAGGERG